MTRSSPTFETLDEVVACVASYSSAGWSVFVRFSDGPAADRANGSWDHESGLELPGLSVNPMQPPSWWKDRPLTEWVVRQINTYRHLKDRDGARRCWLLSGRVVERGPDNEPLLAEPEFIAYVADAVLKECERRKHAHRRDEDEPDSDSDGSAPWQSTPA